MARYFFHLRDGEDQLLDPDGTELVDHHAIEVGQLTHPAHCLELGHHRLASNLAWNSGTASVMILPKRWRLCAWTR